MNHTSETAHPAGREVHRDYLAVARGSDLVVIHVVGSGNMLIAPTLQDFAEQQIKAGFRRFVFDLERCRGLDSTFMGVMVGIHTSMRTESGIYPKVSDPISADLEPLSPEEAAACLQTHLERHSSETGGVSEGALGNDGCSGGAGMVSAVNISMEVEQVMKMLGVDKFVKLRGSCDLKQLETTILPQRCLSPDQRRRLILSAHETLVEIDKRNEAQFGPFLKTLSQELAQS